MEHCSIVPNGGIERLDVLLRDAATEQDMLGKPEARDLSDEGVPERTVAEQPELERDVPVAGGRLADGDAADARKARPQRRGRRRQARPGQGARQGPHRAGARVDARGGTI